MTSFRQVVSYLSGKTSASATPPVSAWETGNRCRCSQIGGIRHTCAALRCMKGMPAWRMFCRNCFRAREVSRHQGRRGCMSSADCKSDRRPFQLPLAVASQPSSRRPPPRCLFVRSLASCQPPTPSAPCPPPPPRPSLRLGKHQAYKQKGDPFSEASHFAISLCVETLQLRAGGYESLACLVVLVLVEVVDEASGEILCLLVPYCGI